MNGTDLILEGVVKLLAPLSHIGESTGTESFLNTVNILGPDGEPTEVFIYSGNAFRGALRDLAAEYMLSRLSVDKVGLDLFYMLFSGGAIGGEQSVDIDQARRFRALLPMFSLWGGGVGNQIMGGKMQVGAMYPICAECAGILPERFHLSEASWRQSITEQSYTRTDDAKNERLRERFIQAMPDQDRLMLEGETAGKPEKAERKPQQMRYTQELITPGARFYQRIDFKHVTDIELGAFVSALSEFSKHPYLGGQNRIGHGLCEIAYTWREAGQPGEGEHFLSVGPDGMLSGVKAKDSLEAYNEYLARIYEEYLAMNQTTLQKMLEAGVSA
ncbi:MAG TPA: hypothetical protein GXX28_10645 [Firmicutes bacterium]|nr:hypothetical protein [Bacillota bacterium]